MDCFGFPTKEGISIGRRGVGFRVDRIQPTTPTTTSEVILNDRHSKNDQSSKRIATLPQQPCHFIVALPNERKRWQNGKNGTLM